MIEMLMYCEGVTDFEALCAFIMRATPSSKFIITRKTRPELLREIKVLSNRRGIHKQITYIDRLAMASKKIKCKCIAYHQDADHDYKVVYERIKNCLSKYDGILDCLAIVPKEMIESWLLADEKAYILVFGKAPDKPRLPKKAEMIWGEKNDPGSNYPKHVMKRVLEQYNRSPSRDLYAEIAENCSIDTMSSRCPISFGQFLLDLKQLLQSENYIGAL